jgi:hypothetical protein
MIFKGQAAITLELDKIFKALQILEIQKSPSRFQGDGWEKSGLKLESRFLGSKKKNASDWYSKYG